MRRGEGNRANKTGIKKEENIDICHSLSTKLPTYKKKSSVIRLTPIPRKYWLRITANTPTISLEFLTARGPKLHVGPRVR